jgi:hypothetical protein
MAFIGVSFLLIDALNHPSSRLHLEIAFCQILSCLDEQEEGVASPESGLVGDHVVDRGSVDVVQQSDIRNQDRVDFPSDEDREVACTSDVPLSGERRFCNLFHNDVTSIGRANLYADTYASCSLH